MTDKNTTDDPRGTPLAPADPASTPDPVPPRPREIGGPQGLEPTRYGDWERKGRCVDF